MLHYILCKLFEVIYLYEVCMPESKATLLLLLWNISQGCEQHKVKAPLIPQDKKLTKPFLYFVEIDFHLFCLG